MAATRTVEEQLVTAEEFERTAHCYGRAELIDGRIVELPPTRRGHGRVELRVGALLLSYVEAQDLGEVEVGEAGCKLPNGRVRAPDVLFVRKERLASADLTNEGFWPFAPDLAVEIVSPDDTITEVRDKANEWLAGGSTLVWAVEGKQRKVTVYRLGLAPRVLDEEDELDGGEVLPGFRCRVVDFFR